MCSKKTKGFTLMELIIVIGIMGIVAAAASAALLQGFQMYSTSRNMERGQTEARDALMIMGRDMQRAVQVVSEGTDLQILVDVNGEDRILRYRMDGSDLVRTFHEINPDGSRGAELTNVPWSVPFTRANIDSFFARTASTCTTGQGQCPPAGCGDSCPGNDIIALYVASWGIEVTGTTFNINIPAHRNAANVYTNRISLNRVPPLAPPSP